MKLNFYDQALAYTVYVYTDCVCMVIRTYKYCSILIDYNTVTVVAKSLRVNYLSGRPQFLETS